tara:strand:+ start:475 stop:6123 length:5649 start_codon:yes stop_codon:yes gene_type:complete
MTLMEALKESLRPRPRPRIQTGKKTLRNRVVWSDETSEDPYSEITYTVPWGEGYAVIPTVDANGNKLSVPDALQKTFDKKLITSSRNPLDFVTGEELPVFSTEEEANRYAQWRSDTMFDAEAIAAGFEIAPTQIFPDAPPPEVDNRSITNKVINKLNRFLAYTGVKSYKGEIEGFDEGGLTDQMQMFGYTAKGVQQEVDKYVPEPSKGLSYPDIILDSILGLENNYETNVEGIVKQFNKDKMGFLETIAKSIYQETEDFVKAPVELPLTDKKLDPTVASVNPTLKAAEFTASIASEVTAAVKRLSSQDLSTRLQGMFGVDYNNATDDQVSKARESVLGDALIVGEFIPAVRAVGKAVPGGVKADVIGQTKALFQGDKEFLQGVPTEQSNTAGVGANVPGMFPKRSDDGITSYLEEEALDPDFSLIDMDQKYGQYLPSGEAFVNTMRDDKLNLRSLSVDPYIPLLVDTLDGVDSDEYTISEAFDTITKDLKDVAKQRSAYYAPLLNDKDIKLEDIPSITDQQINKINEHGYYNFNRLTNDLGFGPKFKEMSVVTLPDVVTTDYFEQVQADLLFSIEKKIKKEIPELPFNRLARLVGLSNSDELLSDITKDQLATMNTYSEASTKRNFLDKQLTEFIIESGLLDGHYISDPRMYRRVTKNPINDSENFFDLDADAAFFADLTPRTNRLDAITGASIFETDPGKIIDGQRKYKFEAVFGATTTENPHPLFNVTNNESFLINGIKESLKDYLRKLDLNQKTPQGDTLGEVSKVYTEDLIATEARRELISGPNTSRVKDLENIGKIVLLELGQSANKAVPGARVLEALENDPRIKNANIPPYFKSSQFKGRMVTPLEYEELADEYYKKSPAITYPEEVGKDYDLVQRQDLNQNPDSGKFVGGNVVRSYQKEIIAEAGPENRVPAFTVRNQQHYDDRGIAHTRYTEIEPIDVTDESAIRETYPALELRDLGTDLAKGLENFEGIINNENYFLVDELQSDLISKKFDVHKRIPFTKEVVRNALDSESGPDDFTTLIMKKGSSKSIIDEAMSGFDIDAYKDEIFEKLPELVDLYHNTVDIDDLDKIPKLQDTISNSILKKEKKSFNNLSFEEQKDKIIESNKSLGEIKSVVNKNIRDLNTPEDDYFKKQKREYFAQFEVNFRHFLNQADRASHYDKNYTDNNVGLSGVVRQATINQKARENPDSYKKPPITTTEEGVQQNIQRLIFEANRRGVNKIVIPNFDRIAAADRYKGKQLFHALQNKSYDFDTGEIKDGQALYRTYVSSLEKVLPKFEEAYGITIHRDVTLPYLKDGIGNFSERGGDPIRFSDKGIILDITNMKEDFDLSRPAFAEGGTIMNKQMEMAFMKQGGIKDDGMTKDPVSGNEIPPGSMATEVRDNIPAMLSEGEYVVPADVLRYYGVNFFENLRGQAKNGLQSMEQNGRIGGTPMTQQDVARNMQQPMAAAQGAMMQSPIRVQQQPAPQAMGNTVQPVKGFNSSSVVTPNPMPSTVNPANLYAKASFQNTSSYQQNLAQAQEEQKSQAVTTMVKHYSNNGDSVMIRYDQLPGGTPTPAPGQESELAKYPMTELQYTTYKKTQQQSQGSDKKPNPFDKPKVDSIGPLKNIAASDAVGVEDWAKKTLEITGTKAVFNKFGPIGRLPGIGMQANNIAEVRAMAKYRESLGGADNLALAKKLNDQAKAAIGDNLGLLALDQLGLMSGEGIYQDMIGYTPGQSQPSLPNASSGQTKPYMFVDDDGNPLTASNYQFAEALAGTYGWQAKHFAVQQQASMMLAEKGIEDNTYYGGGTQGDDGDITVNDGPGGSGSSGGAEAARLAAVKRQQAIEEVKEEQKTNPTEEREVEPGGEDRGLNKGGLMATPKKKKKRQPKKGGLAGKK